MNELTLSDKLHYYLPHRLNVLCSDTKEEMLLVGISDTYTVEVVDVTENDRCRLLPTSKDIDDSEYPIYLFRPLSSLTKEITVAGYNEGKPFVPSKILNNRLKSHRILHDGKIYCTLHGKTIDVKYLPFSSIDMLLNWHFFLWDFEAYEKQGLILKIED